MWIFLCQTGSQEAVEAERDNGNMEGDLVGDYIHPAINNRAKWY